MPRLVEPQETAASLPPGYLYLLISFNYLNDFLSASPHFPPPSLSLSPFSLLHTPTLFISLSLPLSSVSFSV